MKHSISSILMLCVRFTQIYTQSQKKTKQKNKNKKQITNGSSSSSKWNRNITDTDWNKSDICVGHVCVCVCGLFLFASYIFSFFILFLLLFVRLSRFITIQWNGMHSFIPTNQQIDIVFSVVEINTKSHTKKKTKHFISDDKPCLFHIYFKPTS